jgi:hypothetical protein
MPFDIVFCFHSIYVSLHFDSVQETRKFYFSNMDGGILIKFGEMMFFLAVSIYDTGKHFLACLDEFGNLFSLLTVIL